MSFHRWTEPHFKPPKIKNGTAAGLKHMGRVKHLPCVICGAHPPSDAHHCRSNGQARDDFKTIPLCKPCHLGPKGYHSAKETWEAENGPDTDYLAVVADMLAGEFTSPWANALRGQRDAISKRRDGNA